MDKRERGEGTIQLRGDTWRLRYRVNGKRFTQTVCGTKGDALKELRRLLQSADEGEHIAPAKMTLNQWYEQWVLLLERRQDGVQAKRGRGAIGARTLERYQELMRLHVLPKLGNRPLQRLTPTEFDDLYLALEGKRSAGRRLPLCRRTKGHHQVQSGIAR
jgi:integrase